jgi:histidinol-phosphatase (PHP family)
VERGKILELKTRRLNQNTAVDALKPVYKRYKDFGGKFITIGSDAHVVGAVGANFDVALKFAEELNLKIFAGFRH